MVKYIYIAVIVTSQFKIEQVSDYTVVKGINHLATHFSTFVVFII